MNTDLIPVFTAVIGSSQVNTVDARVLHGFLEVGRDFSTWIKSRIDEYGFEEGKDYSPVWGHRSGDLPGKPRTDYTLSMDMAKELAMVERSPKGKEARQYFIECERRLMERPAPVVSPAVPMSTMARGFAPGPRSAR